MIRRWTCLLVFFALLGGRWPCVLAADELAKSEDTKRTDLLLVATVLDGNSGDPIKNFTVLPGTGRMEGLGWQWQPHMVTQCQDGKLQWPPEGKRGYDLQVLRIEAAGYQTYHTPPIKVLREAEQFDSSTVLTDSSGKVIANVTAVRPGGPFQLTVRLHRDAGVSARVVDPSGGPVSGAVVAVGMAARSVGIEDGQIALEKEGPNMPLRDRWSIPKNTTTDADGRFTLPTEIAPAVVVMTHAKGFCAVEFNDVRVTPVIQLQPWGRIEGQVLWGEVPGAHELMTIHAHGGKPTNRLDLGLMIRCYLEVTSDGNGRFTFDRVPPGMAQLSRASANDSGVYMMLAQHIDVLSGETTKVVFGGKGRPIVGRLAGRDRWDNFRVRVALKAPSMGGFIGRDNGFASYGAFLASPAGANYVKNDIHVQADGSFRIDPMPPAQYQLFVDEMGDAGKRDLVGGSQFLIELIPNGQTDEPYDIGVVTVRGGANVKR